MAFNQKSDSNDIVNSTCMNAIAENDYFNEKGVWKKFVRNYLKLTEGEISTIQSNYEREGVMEVRYQHLQKWKHIIGYSATEKLLQNLFEQLKNDRHRSVNQQPESEERSGDGIRVYGAENLQPSGVCQPVQEQHQPEVSVRDGRDTREDATTTTDVREESIRAFCDPVAETELKAAAMPPASACRDDRKGNDMYSIQEKCKGKVLIINNSFAGTQYEREGSDKDVNNMKNLWEKLKFQVIVVLDVRSKDDFSREIEKFKNILTKDDVVVAFIMSHGYQKDREEYIFTNNCESVKKNDLIALFNGHNLSKLIDRPKIFFFQMCRGEEAKPGVEIPVPIEQENNMQSSQLEDTCDAIRSDTLHPSADMLICDATQSGERAFRNIEGSWFINAIFHVFNQHADSEHVEEMMTKVNRSVADKTSFAPSQLNLHNCKVICDKHSRLRYKLYLL